MPDPLRVAISGSSGLIGSALRHALVDAGHEVTPIVRREARSGEISWDPSGGHLDAESLAEVDALVNLSGAGIGDHRWTDEYRSTIRSSRIDSTGLLAEAIAELGDRAPRVLLNASAIGYYGDRGDAELTERADPGTGFLPDVCVDWEAATAPAEASTRVVHLRTGIVLTSEGGALKKMLPLFKLGVGGRFGSGHQWMSWISLHDHIRAIMHLLDSEVSGPVNLTAPVPVTNREFTATLGSVLHRPTLVPVPAFGPKLLLGSDLAQALLFDSARVLPSVLEADGFEFAHAGLVEALEFVLDADA